ncbi:MAG: hypothetical protein HPY71_04030 [Firmicutes bacterium]|nr:hypothetical protein [Bacillota bacterium]
MARGKVSYQHLADVRCVAQAGHQCKEGGRRDIEENIYRLRLYSISYSVWVGSEARMQGKDKK